MFRVVTPVEILLFSIFLTVGNKSFESFELHVLSFLITLDLSIFIHFDHFLTKTTKKGKEKRRKRKRKKEKLDVEEPHGVGHDA
jgi:uncharacterized membrane protein